MREEDCAFVYRGKEGWVCHIEMMAKGIYMKYQERNLRMTEREKEFRQQGFLHCNLKEL